MKICQTHAYFCVSGAGARFHKQVRAFRAIFPQPSSCPSAALNANKFTAESRCEFLDKLQRSYSDAMQGGVALPILSQPGSNTIPVGNWKMSCKKQDELTLSNSDGQQVSLT